MFPYSFPRLRAYETFVAETFLVSEKQKIAETFCFRNKCLPVCAPRKQCWLHARVTRAAFLNLSKHKLSFSVKSSLRESSRGAGVFLVYPVVKHCFSLVCVCNASSFAGAFRNKTGNGFKSRTNFVSKPIITRFTGFTSSGCFAMPQWKFFTKE